MFLFFTLSSLIIIKKGRTIMADLEELIKINKKKKEAGLPEVKIVMRNCLCCQRSFAAIGKHERICKECKSGVIKRGTGIRGDVV